MQFQGWFINGYGLAGLFALAIAAWAVQQHFWYSRQFRTFEGHIREAMGLLSSIAGPSEFYHRLRSSAKTLEANPVLGRGWKEYRATLLPARGEKPLRSPRAASEFFNEDLYRSGNINVRAYEALPNQFVGVGLCLTFLGLIISLLIAQDVISANADQATGELSKLLQAASFKFITSVVALLASVFFVFAKNRRLFQTERQIAAFCEQLERLIPPVTPEELAEESNQELARQGIQLEAANKILATGIADALENKLTNAMVKANEPMLQTIRNMTDRLSDINRLALEHMAHRFSETLAGAAQKHTDKMAEQLHASAEAIGKAPEAIRDASVAMNEELRNTAEAMDKVFGAWSTKMATASDEAASNFRLRIIEHSNTLVEATRQESHALLEGLSSVADQLVSAPGRISLASEAFEATIQKAGEMVSTSFETASNSMNDAFTQVGDKTAAGVLFLDALVARTEAMAIRMHEIADTLTGQMTNVFKGADEVTSQLGTISSEFSKVGDAAKQVATLSTRFESIGGELNSSARSLAEVAQLTQISSKEAQAMLSKMEERAASMDRELQQFDIMHASAVQKLGDRIETSSADVGQRLFQIHSRVAESLDAFAAAVHAFNESAINLIQSSKVGDGAAEINSSIVERVA
jgi:hypothetical protein